MTEKVKHIPVDDPIGDLAKVKEETFQKKEHQKRLEILLQFVISGNEKKSFNESEEQIDTLGILLQFIENPGISTKKELEILKKELPKNITANPKKAGNKKVIPEKKPNVLLDTIKKLVPPDVYRRFPTAYKNYKNLPESLRKNIFTLSNTLGIRHIDILGLFATETNFNRFAVSPANARGLAQVIDTTGSNIGKFIKYGSVKNSGKEEKFFAKLRSNSEFMHIFKHGNDDDKNVAIGMAYISFLFGEFPKEKALRIYNGGYRLPNVKENLEYPKRVIAFSQLFRSEMKGDPDIQYAQK